MYLKQYGRQWEVSAGDVCLQFQKNKNWMSGINAWSACNKVVALIDLFIYLCMNEMNVSNINGC